MGTAILNRYWLVITGPEGEPGIDGGTVFRRGPPPRGGEPVASYVCIISVTNADEIVVKTLKAGAEIALPKMPITGVGWAAYCKDTEGNIFGAHQADKTAA